MADEALALFVKGRHDGAQAAKELFPHEAGQARDVYKTSRQSPYGVQTDITTIFIYAAARGKTSKRRESMADPLLINRSDTVLGGVIEFFGKIGIFDVVLPFLLVFTMMFAVLERTKVLGTEGKDKNPRKNLNAMVAFVVAFLVLASGRLVAAVTSVSSNIIILVMLAVFFLLTMGAFHKEGELGEKGIEGTWRTIFLIMMFIGVIVIFMNALTVDDGRTWWDYSIDYLDAHWDSTAVASIALIIAIVAFVWFMTKSPSEKGAEKKGD
jgi:hypothetical protein